MDIRIGQIIKKLRKEQDVTQEKLAEYLGISYQAVSKWENGTALPDITLVPALANFFGVSPNDLFAIEAKVTDEKVKEYEAEFNRLDHLGDVKGKMILMRKAIEEYPRNFQFMVNLAYALTNYHSTEDQEKESKECGYVEEAIRLCERILEDCKEDNIRHQAIQILCYKYPQFGKLDEAKKLANNMPAMAISNEMLLEVILTGEEKIIQSQQNILLHIDWAALSLTTLSYDKQMGKELSLEQKISFFEAANKLYETIMPDGNYLFYNNRLAWHYYRMAELWCAQGEKAKAMENLESAAKYAEDYDSLPEAAKYTSIFLDRCINYKDKTAKNWMGTERSLLFDRMGGPDFDSIRDIPEFKALSERLSK